MTNKELIEKFRDGATKGIAGRLYIDGNLLKNYETIIAYRDADREFHLNVTHYTRTTTKIQNYCKQILNPKEIYKGPEEFNKLDFGVKNYKASDIY